MAVRIRLSRVGKKHVPFFRLVAVDSRSKRDGKVLSHIATYDALHNKVVLFYKEELDKWLACGALLTDSAHKVVNLYRKEGVFISIPKAKIARVSNQEVAHEGKEQQAEG